MPASYPLPNTHNCVNATHLALQGNGCGASLLCSRSEPWELRDSNG